MGIVEKVAKALAKMSGVDPDATHAQPWDGGCVPPGKPAWTYWQDEARAAIEAMREPTSAMKNAGALVHQMTYEPYRPDPNGLVAMTLVSVGKINPEQIWPAMIDAALSEKQA